MAGLPASCLFERESRFGIGIEGATGTTREGALYEAEFIRPCEDVGLLVEVVGYNGWPAHGMMRLGGEGRAARFTTIEPASPWPAPPGPLPKRFLLYLATPARFDNGWQPRDGDWSRCFDGNVTLVAAAVGRYESVGGFDWAKHGAAAHKPAHRYVPAGSVYYFEAAGAAHAPAAVTDHGAEIGLGQYRIEEW